MTRGRTRTLTGVVALALLVGTIGEAEARRARVRVIHNYSTSEVPQPAAVDVRVGTAADAAANPVAATLAYGDISKYLALKPGTYTVGVFAAGGTTTKLLDMQLTLAKGDRLTILARQVSSADGAFTAEPLSDTGRRSTRKAVNVRVIHGIPAAAADGVRIGAAGVGCITGPVSFPAQAIVTVPKGKYTLGVYPPSDPTCSGSPIPGLSLDAVLKAKRVYTAIAQFKKGDPSAFQLQAVPDF